MNTTNNFPICSVHVEQINLCNSLAQIFNPYEGTQSKFAQINDGLCSCVQGLKLQASFCLPIFVFIDHLRGGIFIDIYQAYTNRSECV